ncbi:FtsW/RodA/SpoVE family cell cycle protein [uncultured Enterococcus sp.]|uniref:FtsW/RodA/SpoVE family cell cycle protein n=1 Tax=uncultured Enterococcus sp. TaxID=167972 RepID=UPI0025CD74B2|nr:FtsW/RodA/SpoVE family cell cycle protein [uncultured Enterococcus sp.]
MRRVKQLDWVLLVPYLVLSIIGLLEIYSASSYRLLVNHQAATSLLIKQFIFMLLSWFVIGVTYSLKLRYFLQYRIAKIGIIVSLVTLIMVKVGLFAVTVNGAQRWLSIFGFQFQPAELANLALILYLAYVFRSATSIPKKLLQTVLIVITMAILVLFQPKIAGAFMILFIAGMMFWAALLPFKKGAMIAGGATLGLVLVAGGVLFLGSHDLLPGIFAHAYERIALVKNPFLDEHGSGYQMANSYYALYNGGLFGRGIGNSITKKGYLPESETDFIFSILTEELGLIVALGVILLLFGLCLRLFQLATKTANQQAALILLGIGLLIFSQTCINLASILGFIPMTGVPLPFISYGGTSYLILSFAIGLALNISANQKRGGLDA